ncbi:unnamed protein product, partial [Effrenium voratum]
RHCCVDPWLSHVLLQARYGRLSQEVWCFLHGYPTLHAGSWCPNSGQCDCKQDRCNGLAVAWQREIQSGTPRSWDVRVREECDVCATERERRRIVAGSARETPDPQAAKFLEGPFVHGFNAAKYVAALLRARWVAHERQHVLLWVVAQDTPLFQLEPEAAIGELQARKENWLQRHDQATGGIMGLLPLLPSMPVRVTQTLPELRPLRLFKNSRAKLLNWCLQDADAAAVQATTATEVVLQSMPTCLLIQVEGATWKQLPSLPAGVACIRPVQQHWKVAATGSATVLRRGFPVACDYAGTAHSFMGATLPACTLDLGFWDSTPSRDAQLSAYMCLSRVKRAEDLCVSRPFGPNLLGQGDLTGPRTLLETHRQTITLEEAKVRFQQEAKQRSRHPEVLLSCRLCSVARAGQESLKPLTAFLANEDAARFSVVAQGMDRVCRACRAKCPAGQSRQAECGDTLCAWCQGVPMTQPGLCKICSTKPLACSKCGDAAKKGQKRTLADFNLDEILRNKRTKELRRARCKQCEAAAPIRATKAAKCKQCGHWKSRSHVTGLDSEANEGICRTCATRNAKPPAQPPAKACQQCGNALPKYATPGTWCDSCAFPPCQGGCKSVARGCARHGSHNVDIVPEGEELVKVLLKRRANPNARAKDKGSCLMLAAEKGDLKIVKTLLSKKADINAKNVMGNSSLLLSVMTTKDTVARFLLNSQADCNAKNKDGTTALDFAIKLKMGPLKSLLDVLTRKSQDRGGEDDDRL